MSQEFLWYIPNTVTRPPRRHDTVDDGHGSLDYQVTSPDARAARLDRRAARHRLGPAGHLHRRHPLAARTTTFEPLIAIRPGYWRPANFASAAATLDQLTAAGSGSTSSPGRTTSPRTATTRATRPSATPAPRSSSSSSAGCGPRRTSPSRASTSGSTDSTVVAPSGRARRPDAPPALLRRRLRGAEQVSATEADVQLFWGEPLDGVAERIERLQRLERRTGPRPAPLEFGLRITTLVRDTTEQAWADAEAKVAEDGRSRPRTPPSAAEPAQRLGRRPAAAARPRRRGEVLDDNLYTAPGRYGGGGAGTTWLVGSADGRRRRAAQVPGARHHATSCCPTRPTAGDRAGWRQAAAPAARGGAGRADGLSVPRRRGRWRPPPARRRRRRPPWWPSTVRQAAGHAGAPEPARREPDAVPRTRPPLGRLVGRDDVLPVLLGQRLVVEQDLPQPLRPSPTSCSRLGSGAYSSIGTVMKVMLSRSVLRNW